MLAGNDGGYFYSTDGGQSWQSNSNTSDMVTLMDFDLQPDLKPVATAWDTFGFDPSGNAFAGGTGDGYYVVADPGQSGQYWTLGNTGSGFCCEHFKNNVPPARCDLPGASCGSGRVLHDHIPPVNIYMRSTANSRAVYTSTSADGGQNWTQLSALAPDALYDIGVGTRRSNAGTYLYAFNNPSRTKVYVLHPLTASAWSDVTSNLGLLGTVTRIETHPGSTSTQTKTAWVLGASPAQILQTTNGGGTWTDITGNLPTNDLSFGPQDIAVDPVTNALYVGTSAGVYKSTDGGKHWSRWTLNLPGDGTQPALTLRTTDQRPQGLFKVCAGLFGSGIWWRDGTE